MGKKVMNGWRLPASIGLAGVLSAGLVAASAAPAAAADNGWLTIVNGRPGVKVDVCLNGKEIRSGLAYGGKKTMQFVKPGNKKLKFFKRDPRTCRGIKLGQRFFDLEAGGDKTIVLTKRTPKKVLFWDNAAFAVPGPLSQPFAYRHASDIGNITFKYYFFDVPSGIPVIPTPAFDPTWTKGTQGLADWAYVPNRVFGVEVTRPASSSLLLPAVQVRMSDERRVEHLLVGTRKKNLKIVTVRLPFEYQFP